METLSIFFDKVLLDSYNEVVYSYKLGRRYKTLDIQVLVGKTTLMTDFNELYMVLKELGESDKFSDDDDAFTCWILSQVVSYFLTMKYDFIQFMEQKLLKEEKNKEESPSSKNVLAESINDFLLGESNELLDQNARAIREFYIRKKGKAFVKKIEKMTKKAYYLRKVEDKIDAAMNISKAQVNFYSTVNKRLSNVDEFKAADRYANDWRDRDIEQLYIDVMMMREKTNALLAVMNVIRMQKWNEETNNETN